MTDWIEHTTDTCPVDPETVVEVRYRGAPIARRDEARFMGWHRGSITHYRIITPATPQEPEGKEIDPRGTQMWTEKLVDGRIVRCRVTAVGPNGAVPPTDDAPGVTFKYPLLEDPEPEMAKTHEDYTGPTFGVPTKPEPDLITLRLECLKLAVQRTRSPEYFSSDISTLRRDADALLHYVLNGSVDKA